jgi:hypothetical protein
MTNTVKTTVYAGVALVLGVLAVVLSPRAPSDENFNDRGQQFFAEFTSLKDCTQLEIREADPVTGDLRSIRLRPSPAGWVIATSQDFPVENTKPLEVCGAFIGLVKDTIRGDDPTSHARFGLGDPADDKARASGGCGRRYSFAGKEDGTMAADYIVGLPVDGRDGYRYVRMAGRNRVYEARLDIELSPANKQSNTPANVLDTQLTDWIETDAFRAHAPGFVVTRMVLNQYEIAEKGSGQFHIVNGQFQEVDNVSIADKRDVLDFRKGTDAGAKWTLDGLDQGKDELNETALDDLAKAVQALTLANVAKKFQPLRDMETAGKFTATPKATLITQPTATNRPGERLMWVNDRTTGLLLVEAKGYLLSNLGEIDVEMQNGLRLTIHLGDIAKSLDTSSESAEENAKTAKDGAKDGTATAAAKPANAGIDESNVLRHCMFEARFDAALLPEPVAPVDPDAPAPGTDPSKPADPAKPADGTQPGAAPAGTTPPAGTPTTTPPAAPKKMTHDEYEKAKKEHETKHKDWEKKKTEATKKADELSARFKDWLFLVPENQITKLRKTRGDLVKLKGATAATPPAPSNASPVQAIPAGPGR